MPEQRRDPLLREREVQTAAIARPERKPAKPQINPIFLPQTVAYDGPEKPGTIVIDADKVQLALERIKGGHLEKLQFGNISRDGPPPVPARL
jgi:lipoprotein-anchoring transpeptidase ErfK/SrfK